jgi:AraC-like DNA-binding protein
MPKCFAILICQLLAVSLHGQLTIILEQIPANTPTKDSIFLSGDINNWNVADTAFQFHKNKEGLFSLHIEQYDDQAFEFKLTRGSWERVETDFYGQFVNNHKCDGQSDTIWLKVRSWDDLPVTSQSGWIKIRLKKLPDNTPPEANLYAVGNFNAWHPKDPAYRLEQNESGQFEVNIPIMHDTLYYKFSRGSWETIEGRRSGRARENRLFILGQATSNELTLTIESWEDLAGNPINWYTFVLLLAAFQSILLILAINTVQDNNRAANRVLSLLLLILTIALAARVSTYDREIFNSFPRLLMLPDLIYFLYAPIFLIYISKLLRLSSQIRYWEFIPFLIHLIAYVPYLWMDKSAFIADVIDLKMRFVFALWGGIALVYNTIYWFVCRRTIRLYESEHEESHAFEPNLNFLRVVMWLKLACLLIWVTTYVIGALGLLLDQDLRFLTDKTTDALWIVFSLTTFFLGYYTMRQPEIFKLPPTDEEPTNENIEDQEKAATMDDTELQSIKLRLEKLMEEKQPYRNPGLSLNQLAEFTGTSLHSLSRVINEGFEVNFNDFVNAYRINEFKELVKDENYQNHTLLAIAFIVGFNSKSAFNRSFKKLEGCTPREFLKRETKLT